MITQKLIICWTVLILSVCQYAVFAQSDIETLLKKSLEYEQQDKLAEAVGELTKAIALEPNNADLYLRRAEINRFLDRNESLAADAEKAFSLNPDDKIVVLRSSHLLSQVNECAESLNILNNYIFKNVETGDVFAARSHVQMCLGDWISAYQDMAMASELNPENNNYRTNQAGLLAQLGNSADVAEKFNQLIKSLETKVSNTTNEGEKERAGDDLGKVYLIRAGVNRAKGDTTAELADLSKFIEYSPKAFSYRIRAQKYRDHRMLTEAITDYTEAIRLSPAESIFFLERGDVFYEVKKYDEAVKDYTQSVKLDPTLKEIVERKISNIKTQSQ